MRYTNTQVWTRSGHANNGGHPLEKSILIGLARLPCHLYATKHNKLSKLAFYIMWQIHHCIHIVSPYLFICPSLYTHCLYVPIVERFDVNTY